jgi:hypothetical protein
MRSFIGSLPAEDLQQYTHAVASRWHERRVVRGLDQVLSLLWGGLARANNSSAGLRRALQKIVGDGLDLSSITLQGIATPPGSEPADLSRGNATRTEFVECDLSSFVMSGMNLQRAVFDACVLRATVLRDAVLTGVFLLDCDLTLVDLTGADLRTLDADSTAFFVGQELVVLSGDSLIGYLRHRGARTDPVDPYHVYRFQNGFDIAEKIFRYLLEGTWRQMRGIVQRGASSRNTPYAKALVEYLLSIGYVVQKYGRRPVVSATSEGRAAFASFLNDNKIDQKLERFFSTRQK